MSRINTNIPALVAQRQLRRNQLDLTTSMNRLSTGLRINRGADDPAGLIASEILRKEIRGIRQAVDNSQRAINVIATAEGALNEVSSLLLDLRALIGSSANVGALSPDETKANQQEIDSILASIDRIANTTSFANRKLIDGSQGYVTSGVNLNALASVELFAVRLPTNTTRDVILQVTNSAETANLSFTGASTSAVTIELTGIKGADTLSFASGTTIDQIAIAINGTTDLTGVSATISGGSLRLDSTDFGSRALVSVRALSGNFIEANAGTTIQDHGVDAGVLVNGQAAAVDGLKVEIRSESVDGRFYLTQAAGQTLSSTSFTVTGGGSLYQIAADLTVAGQVHVGLQSVRTASLGNSVTGFLHSIRSGETNEVADGNFLQAELIVTEAISQIASLRGRLGSIQKNQLETNINSQSIALENVTASESIIRDADFAVETSNLTRAQILVQSTQASLQIANNLPQTVLSLLG